eukprot:snap_masked-scaffold_2-processed-gene-1.29-mRNA-1 protein AED:1.00 eAED:1.00 QI:0/0/0/0/1/1/2/0/484
MEKLQKLSRRPLSISENGRILDFSKYENYKFTNGHIIESTKFIDGLKKIVENIKEEKTHESFGLLRRVLDVSLPKLYTCSFKETKEILKLFNSVLTHYRNLLENVQDKNDKVTSFPSEENWKDVINCYDIKEKEIRKLIDQILFKTSNISTDTFLFLFKKMVKQVKKKSEFKKEVNQIFRRVFENNILYWQKKNLFEELKMKLNSFEEETEKQCAADVLSAEKIIDENETTSEESNQDLVSKNKKQVTTSFALNLVENKDYEDFLKYISFLSDSINKKEYAVNIFSKGINLVLDILLGINKEKSSLGNFLSYALPFFYILCTKKLVNTKDIEEFYNICQEENKLEEYFLSFLLKLKSALPTIKLIEVMRPLEVKLQNVYYSREVRNNVDIFTLKGNIQASSLYSSESFEICVLLETYDNNSFTPQTQERSLHFSKFVKNGEYFFFPLDLELQSQIKSVRVFLQLKPRELTEDNTIRNCLCAYWI